MTMASTESMRPPTTTLTMKAPTSGAATDKYASFQRKLDALEKVHAEGKKSYQADLDRLKSELARAQRTTTEHVERIEKLKKHNEALDARVHDLKKAGVTDQLEIKDLRVKLRLAENERAQLASKNGEAGETKKALHALEVRRRDELRERDRRIVELEKNVVSERRKREVVEAQLSDLKGKSDSHDTQMKEITFKVEKNLTIARAEAEEARAELETVCGEAEEQREDLVGQLTALRTMLCRVAEQYGRLAAASVSKTVHSELMEEHHSLQLCTFRLERKLANSEGQVIELANLIRQVHEDRDFDLARLRDARDELKFRCFPTPGENRSRSSLDTDSDDLATLRLDSLTLEKEKAESAASTDPLFAQFYRTLNHDLIVSYRSAVEELADEQALLKTRTTELEAAKSAQATVAAEVQSLRGELDAAHREQAEAALQLESSQNSATALREQLANVEKQQKEASVAQRQALQKEKEVTQKMIATVQRHKMAEEGLRAEIEQLSAELVEAERFQEAYNSLVEHVEGLAARNALAEDEAERLSQFNSEILSHNNPAQRIMYLDRIRRELAEAKQTLVTVSREKENALAQGEDLFQELAMYKSVAPSGDHRPRTNITRVARIPLAAQSINGQSVNVPSITGHRLSDGKYDLPPSPVAGMMTLDEIN